MTDETMALNVKVDGSASSVFAAYRTSPDESYVALGEFTVKDGYIACTAPAGSVTMFFGSVSIN